MHGLYRVTGSRPYRGHDPGDEFEALIAPNAERRAIDRGDIVLLARVEPRLRPGSYRFPDGWLPANTIPQPEAPKGASFVQEV